MEGPDGRVDRSIMANHTRTEIGAHVQIEVHSSSPDATRSGNAGVPLMHYTYYLLTSEYDAHVGGGYKS